MKTDISTAPVAIYKNYVGRLHGDSSMARGYLNALEYARVCHYATPPYQPIYGVIAARLQASGDFYAFRCFCNSHSDELRAEQEAEQKYNALEKWREGEPAETIVARNQAAVAADQLEQAINARGEQIAREREFAARARAFADARKELTR